MRQRSILIFIICLILYTFSKSQDEESHTIITIDASSVIAQSAAQFVVEKLQKLSDSTIYETITLNRVISARQQDGIYHDNILLEVEIRSPYFKSRKELEIFSIVLMTNKKDKITSYAIDEFPVMDETAIEEFYIEKIKRKRRNRESAYRQLQLKVLSDRIKSTDQNSSAIIEEVMKDRTIYDKIQNNAKKRKESIHKYIDNVNELTSQEYLIRLQKEEVELSNYTLDELFHMLVNSNQHYTTKQKGLTDYQYKRAGEILDTLTTSDN